MRRTRAPRSTGRASVGTAVVLMAVGGVIAFAVRPPAQVTRYVDVPAVGLVLVWAGVLLLVMQVVMHRPRRPRRLRGAGRSAPAERTDQWYENDVHAPGYAGQTRQLPAVRASRRGR